jgi:integrase/recombinase XerD
MDCRKWIDKYSTDCRLKYISGKTHKNYGSSVAMFLRYFEHKYREPKEIPTDDIKNWLLTFGTINTRNHKLCGIKSFYEITVGMPVKMDKIPFSQKDKKLPIVLSQNEVQKMFNVCTNAKHKTILAILYSCGLRVSELINLKWQNVDRERMVINIIAGKGNKDRQVMLPPQLIPLLEKYWLEYKSKEFIFEGQFKDQYSAKSVGEVMKQLAEKAGINKRVYSHLMRHNCFTHMVENGVDINIIQKIAGHSNVKTTAIYTHISHNIISKIQSPLSDMPPGAVLRLQFRKDYIKADGSIGCTKQHVENMINSGKLLCFYVEGHKGLYVVAANH